MAAQPVQNQSTREAEQPDVNAASGASGVQAVEQHPSPEHVASPAHALQARLAAELTAPKRMSLRRILSTLLVLSLSTWLAVFILYAAL
jgi:hypothetical protein